MKKIVIVVGFLVAALAVPTTALADPVDVGVKRCRVGEQGVVVYKNDPYTGETSVAACF